MLKFHLNSVYYYTLDKKDEVGVESNESLVFLRHPLLVRMISYGASVGVRQIHGRFSSSSKISDFCSFANSWIGWQGEKFFHSVHNFFAQETCRGLSRWASYELKKSSPDDK